MFNTTVQITFNFTFNPLIVDSFKVQDILGQEKFKYRYFPNLHVSRLNFVLKTNKLVRNHENIIIA